MTPNEEKAAEFGIKLEMLVNEYGPIISAAKTIGILDMMKFRVMSSAMKEFGENPE